MSTSRKKSVSKKTPKKAPRVLSDEDSALVIAEYLAIEKVNPSEIDAIIEGDGPYRPTYRETALVFRVSEILGIPCCFKIAPRYRLAFERAQEYLRMLAVAQEARAA